MCAPGDARDPIRALVVGLDEWLRRQNGMLEYSDSPDCMLRVVRRRAECEMTLSDGVVVVRGDPILDLHFWNERIPQTSATQGLGEPTGWHYHVCEHQLVYMLKGWVDLEFEDGRKIRLMSGDSLMIPGGMRHNEIGTADELELLEVSVPAEMKTVVCEPPAGMG